MLLEQCDNAPAHLPARGHVDYWHSRAWEYGSRRTPRHVEQALVLLLHL
jgi:hypothetical protein